jgi:hypothetical protein
MGYLFRLPRYRIALLGNVGRWLCVTLLSKACAFIGKFPLNGWFQSFLKGGVYMDSSGELKNPNGFDV